MGSLMLLFVETTRNSSACIFPVILNELSSTVETITHFPEVTDGECVFPFHYKNGTYYDCIKSKARHKWCSLNKTYEGYWKFCSAEDFANCVFPFWYRRLIYWECTDDGEAFGKKWCSLTKNFNKDRIWKYCE
ncbi:binder of sperm protein homolog 1 [Homo sapiens]|uniref:Binder of sperm protein homolog 1 n=1 Tax=Homo sapiens TaxID=9606 RepID=BSPH1_HUMAN|nr:binder of sperm protein homolog 1 precursor [Homo sapiens]XP_016881607.1 binder of sperm protein homolog 1 isoform X1 [Homo sapiens]XP_054175435.1 binder of sperm protein homolog 1 isoform X1 [Homo sapiens]Q075Z2.1 RecName: Full=Binder of sperm protein homolog 1; AltName: Full=Bovine seminal plasma protein homolog 1; AltName: Full=Bovine seminal plasma protein-like 1; Flags: Precursor [Homo sapiens]ABB71591.1 bovine seminal plasma protein-like 1 [Homo sapiens]KAI2592002.1 binder of sperm pr|eukprot:NP_001121798.1 binder of sperm protein homolog 1 precursor [Homo sapiens]